MALNVQAIAETKIKDNGAFAAVRKGLSEETAEVVDLIAKAFQTIDGEVTPEQIAEIAKCAGGKFKTNGDENVAKKDKIEMAKEQITEDPKIAEIKKAHDAEMFDLRKELAAERMIRKERDFIAKAAQLGNVPGFTGETLGRLLMDADEHLAKENAEALLKHFAGAAAIAADLTKIVGRSEKPSDLAKGFQSQIDQVVSDIRKADSKLTEQQALEQAFSRNPDLYNEYRANRFAK